MGSWGKPGLNEEQIARMFKQTNKLYEELNAMYQEAREAVPINSTAFNRLDKANNALKSLQSYLHNQYYIIRSV